MGNTIVREGKVFQGRPVSEGINVHPSNRLAQDFGVPPSGHHQQHLQHPGHPGGLGHSGSTESMGHSPPDSPGSAARSPLVFAPQVPMVPIPKADELGLGRYQQAGGMYGEVPSYVQPDRGVATMIVWNYGGNNVSIQGSWDNWSTRQPLQKSGKEYTIIKMLPSGVYQFKFIVDGKWRYAPDMPAVCDEMDNVNNVLDVQDYVPENLENVAGFDPPMSPESTYCDPIPGPEDYTKEPPAVPPHLHLTLLNVPQAPGALPRPQHSILNHLYVEKGKTSCTVLALGLTKRFRSKYVTTVLYKPVK